MNSPSVDRGVVERARAGDREALVTLWRTFQPMVVRVLRARRCLDHDDVASQVWVTVARSLPSFEGDGDDFRRWVLTTARRRHLDDVRRRARRGECSLDDVAEDRTVDRDAVDLDDVGSLDRALALVAALPEQQAEAVMLRVVYDLDVAETASVMELSEGNVRVLVHRGLTRLRTRLVGAAPDLPDPVAVTPHATA